MIKNIVKKVQDRISSLVGSVKKSLSGKTITVISTFNGVGAFTESLKQLGVSFKMLMVCEIDKNPNKTYYENNEYIKENHTDDINELLKNIKQGTKTDILVQTPPCQSFSIQGLRKGLDSDNGNLFLTSINLQKKIDSNIVIYENVRGLLSHDKKVGEYKSLINKDYKNTIGHTLHTIEKLLLEDTRYDYYWKIINSCDQGLPQNRERIFIVGIKKELDKGSFTFPKNIDLNFTVEDILEENVGENYFYKNTANHTLIPTNQKQRKNKIHTVSNYSDTMTYESTRRVYNPYVSPCITTNNNNKFMINGKIRHLTPTENKRIQGFREEFVFVGTQKTQINKQLGNTVSPGVYNNLLSQIFESVDLSKEIPQTLNKKATVVKRKRKVKPISDNHISIKKSITNKPDENYICITKEVYNQYKTHLENSGTISVSINKYKNNTDKINDKLECRYIISIQDLTKLGFRNKKQGVYRVKITGSKDNLEKINKPSVMFSRKGGKNNFDNNIKQGINKLNIKKHTIVVDAFTGGGSFTLKNIETLHFDSWIMNDLDKYVMKTFIGVKKNHKKVMEIFTRLNTNFQNMLPKELIELSKNFKQNESLIEKIRKENLHIKEYYTQLVKEMEINRDIYDEPTIAGMYIFILSKTNSGSLAYNKNGSLVSTSFNWITIINNKVSMIKHWSYLLNHYNIKLYNMDIFELIDNVPNTSTVYSDSPYFFTKKGNNKKETGIDYGFDASVEFQNRLIKSLDKFDTLLYSNESCQKLYNQDIDKHFNDYMVFDRKNNTNNIGGEFLGFRSKNYINKSNIEVVGSSINNQSYQPKELEVS